MATVNRAARFQFVPRVGRFSAYEVTGPIRLLIASSNALIEDPAVIEAQHQPLLDALLAGDRDSAARLFEEHTLTEGRKLEAAVRAQQEAAPDG